MKIGARPRIGVGLRAAMTAKVAVRSHDVALLNVDSRVTVRVPPALGYEAYGRRPIRLGIAYP